MTNAERIIAACHSALDAGPMGDKIRPQDYRAFISCGFNPSAIAYNRVTGKWDPADLGTIKTSCAVFARAVLHAAGRKATRVAKVGQGIMDGYLERLTPWHPAAQWAVSTVGLRIAGLNPPPGAVVYRDYSRTFSTLGHIQILLFETSPGMWITAEGGGGDGTLCKLSDGPKDIFAKDSLGRIPVLWWRPELIDGFEELTAGTPSPTPSPAPLPAPTFVPVALGNSDLPGSSDGPVRAWQRRLQASGVPGTELPRYGADGGFGAETLAATKALISARLPGTTITRELWDLAAPKKA